jgi:hypothetical protein
LRVPVGNQAALSLDLPLIVLIGIAEKRRKIVTCTQTRYKKRLA